MNDITQRKNYRKNWRIYHDRLFRSYTNVRDPKKFKEWVDSLPETVLIEQNSEDGKLYGLLFDNQIPVYREDDDIQFDIYQEIQSHISDGWSITFIEVGATGYDLIQGFSVIVTPSDIKLIYLDQVIEYEVERTWKSF